MKDPVRKATMRMRIWIAVTLLIILIIPFACSSKAEAAWLDGLTWTQSPCEGCLVIVKDLGEGDYRIITIRTDPGNGSEIVDVKRLHCVRNESSELKKEMNKDRQFCRYKIFKELKK
jgi:hypothetical protein